MATGYATNKIQLTSRLSSGTWKLTFPFWKKSTRADIFLCWPKDNSLLLRVPPQIMDAEKQERDQFNAFWVSDSQGGNTIITFDLDIHFATMACSITKLGLGCLPLIS